MLKEKLERQSIDANKELNLEKIKLIVKQNAERVAKLGEWPEYIKPSSLLERIPGKDDKNAPGFDAGIACALDLIPREKQKLSAKLHANYSKEAVMQIRKEFAEKNVNSETMWWLAASSICAEGGVDEKKFLQQIEDFKKLSADKKERQKAAEETFKEMASTYTLKDGIPYGEEDGCIQGAYINGYPFAVQYAKNYGIYFVGTYENSLGLENFSWSDEKDDKGRNKSGPVFGSKQFVKCANKEELKRVLEIVKNKLF